MSDNIRETSQFKTNYECFLCKKHSNFRMPVELKEGDKTAVKKVYDEILATIKQ